MKKVENYMYQGVKWSAVVLFVIMIGLCILQVVCRYVLKISLSFTEELARFLFIWVTFLGTAMAMKKHQHVNMDLLVHLFPESVQRVVNLIVTLFVECTYLMMVYSGVRVMMKTTSQTSPAMNLPMAVVYAAVPVSMLIMAFFQICEFAERGNQK